VKYKIYEKNGRFYVFVKHGVRWYQLVNTMMSGFALQPKDWYKDHPTSSGSSEYRWAKILLQNYADSLKPLILLEKGVLSCL